MDYEKRLYDNFLCHYDYLASKVEWYKITDGCELILYLKDGTTILYDGIEDKCRRLPRDAQSMTEAECNMELAMRLRSIMRRRSCDQRKLASRTGISQPMISRYVTGKTTPSFYNIDRIAKALGCSVDELRYL